MKEFTGTEQSSTVSAEQATTKRTSRVVDALINILFLPGEIIHRRAETKYAHAVQRLYSEIAGFTRAFGIEDIAESPITGIQAGPIGMTERIPRTSKAGSSVAGNHIEYPVLGVIFESAYTGVGHGPQEVVIDIGLDEVHLTVVDELGELLADGLDMGRTTQLCHYASNMLHAATGARLEEFNTGTRDM